MVARGAACKTVALAIIATPLSLAATTPARSFPNHVPSKLENDVLDQFNAVRTQPAGYADALRAYRGYFHQKIVVMPGANVHFQTEEGVVPVDEAIGQIAGQAALPALELSPLLSQSAADHAAEQAITGKVGHFGDDGSTPGVRALRRGGGKAVAEVIAYGAADAADVIRQLMIDDGVADRGHRILMLSGHLRYAGIACGPHPQFRTMCVIDMADTPDGIGGTTTRMAARENRTQR